MNMDCRRRCSNVSCSNAFATFFGREDDPVYACNRCYCVCDPFDCCDVARSRIVAVCRWRTLFYMPCSTTPPIMFILFIIKFSDYTLLIFFSFVQ
uniref:Uncharacterized protein n=1 Tax=Ectropis obliqua nucleopolyhedrovirus TaxID=59376 RepID=A0A8F2PQF7_9ABAC|nr:hypothetical protein QF4000066 [Ectropis obliqua nucleopolyhedrovirus]UYO72877.1 hypothetical protein [Ectropis obliqua nucleopolyhedrovirus]